MNPSESLSPELRPGERLDGLLGGALKVIQPSRGYRFSIDALLLSEFVSAKKGDRVVDLGTGCGVLLLLLLKRMDLGLAIGIEIQKELADQASRNAALNNLSHKMKAITADIREMPLKPGTADLVVCNPPYRRPQSGRLNPDLQRAIARHEILASLADFLKAAANLLQVNGKAAFTYPAERLSDMMAGLRAFSLEPKRLQLVYPNINANAKLALIEAISGARPGLTVLPPLIGQGRFSI